MTVHKSNRERLLIKRSRMDLSNFSLSAISQTHRTLCRPENRRRSSRQRRNDKDVDAIHSKCGLQSQYSLPNFKHKRQSLCSADECDLYENQSSWHLFHKRFCNKPALNLLSNSRTTINRNLCSSQKPSGTDIEPLVSSKISVEAYVRREMFSDQEQSSADQRHGGKRKAISKLTGEKSDNPVVANDTTKCSIARTVLTTALQDPLPNESFRNDGLSPKPVCIINDRQEVLSDSQQTNTVLKRPRGAFPFPSKRRAFEAPKVVRPEGPFAFENLTRGQVNQKLFRFVNDTRGFQGNPPLEWNDELYEMADRRCFLDAHRRTASTNRPHLLQFPKNSALPTLRTGTVRVYPFALTPVEGSFLRQVVQEIALNVWGVDRDATKIFVMRESASVGISCRGSQGDLFGAIVYL